MLLLTAALLPAAEPCRLRVVDAESGWPVPLVELRTTHQVSFFTDNAGAVAFDLPELMGTETWLTVEADGYERKADGFGFRGFRFTPQPGGDHEIAVERTIVAKRLGRLTGGGIFAESQKLGEHADWRESGILGSDSVQVAVHRGRRFWAWGDTLVPRYPLGLFHMASATTALKPLSSFAPPLKLPFDYFRDDDGRVRVVANVFPDDPGPTWISGYVSLPDATGSERLVGCYSKIEPPMKAYRVGLCEWNDGESRFESIEVLWDKKTDGGTEPKLQPVGHPAFWTAPEGKRWLLLGDPFPSIRLPATYEGWRDRRTWESIDPPRSLTGADGRKIKPHRGSIAWNAYRQRWVTVFGEIGGDPSPLGELWYAEADSPLGPWGRAVKVLSHRRLTFYNPRLHPDLTPAGSPILLFEGTYTHSFSKETRQTPRHDYNQILYRLDLDDPALAPARER
ncbi:MAG: hypothetical protein JNK37_08755 [Verrucomicrobiales bacterium]|nr:hypothetical protein [Verrucomicrobiales bacterium]